MSTRQDGVAGTLLAAERLRRAMSDGELAPGQRLVEEELAATFGVSRGSVRVALIDLAAEGLVERIPHRGARVRAVSLPEAIAITECRMALECLCAAKAAERVTDDQVAVLVDLGRQLSAAVAAGDPLRYSACNRELDRLVREYAAQPVAQELLGRLNGQVVRHQFRLALRPGRPSVSLPEHLEIIAAVVARDPGRAEAAVRAHLGGVIAALQQA